MIPPGPYLALHDHAKIGGVAIAALSGDPVAAFAVADWIEEQGESMYHPFETDKMYLIETVTLYYVGRVVKQNAAWLWLGEDTSWVHWTGRLSTLIREQSFTSPRHGTRLPRIEPCGPKFVSVASIVSASPWTGELPKEPQ